MSVYKFKTDIIPLAILISLTIICFGNPINFDDTIDFNVLKTIPAHFWITLIYGLTYPFLKKDKMKSIIYILWAGIIFSLFWGYLPAAEPQLRYWDSFYNSDMAQLIALHGIDSTKELYFAWPGAFIIHVFLKDVTGLSFLILSKILAVTFVFFIGIVLAKLFSLFFDQKKALLCLCAYSLLPFASINHYSPQTVSYLLYLLILYIFWKRRRINVKWVSILVLILLVIIPIHPTMPFFIVSIMLFVLFLESFSGKYQRSFITGGILFLFLATAAGWWSYQFGPIEQIVSIYMKLSKAITTGEFTLERGIFHTYTIPLYVELIRNITLAFLFILIAPSLFSIAKNILKSIIRKIPLSKVDVFFVSIIGGSFLLSLLTWISEGGQWGGRLFLITSPVLAILGIRSISRLLNTVRTRRIGCLLTIMMIAIVPLNFVALNYSESLNQTRASEISAIYFLRSQNILNEILFSDGFTLIRFKYASLNETNIFLFTESLLNPYAIVDNERLIRIPWTYFIRDKKAMIFLHVYYGIDVDHFKELDLIEINKCYDNLYVKIYRRARVFP